MSNLSEKELKELKDELDILLKLVPDDLKANQEVKKQCPFCNSKIKISRAYNNHLWIVCEKEGVLIYQ